MKIRHVPINVIEFVKRWHWTLLGIFITGVLLLFGPTIYANLSTRSVRYDPARTSLNKIPKSKVALVFGAGVNRITGQPTPYLQWRVETAVKLYKAGRVQKLLMSGDNSTKKYNEPMAMRTLAEKLGVKKNDIVLDYAGYSTYDSCYRAHKIFGLSQATLISQGYHLPRAVMSCDALGVNSIGVDAINKGRGWTVNYIIREWLSTDKALVQAIFKPQPTLLGRPMQIK